jgi:hypothetical protein
MRNTPIVRRGEAFAGDLLLIRNIAVAGRSINRFLVRMPRPYHSGDSHADQIEYDEARTTYLNELGYTVIRFTNREVLCQCEAVVQQIADECQCLIGSDQVQQCSD